MLFTLIAFGVAQAQNNRLNTQNTIGWYNYFGTIKCSSKTSVHTEYQWRRDHLISTWQQSLLRVGVNHSLNPRVLLRAGYAWVETFAYGEFPIHAMGRNFTEHRVYEMVQLSHKEERVEFTHRFMLEQRFVGRYSSPNAATEDAFPMLNRLRYMVRLQVPLKGKEMGERTPYAAAYDEVFIGFGKNVNANVFDQNRLAILLGYTFNKRIKIEGGYLNQILQLGRQVNGLNVFQHNQGLILNTYINLDLRKKESATSMRQKPPTQATLLDITTLDRKLVWQEPIKGMQKIKPDSLSDVHYVVGDTYASHSLFKILVFSIT